MAFTLDQQNSKLYEDVYNGRVDFIDEVINMVYNGREYIVTLGMYVSCTMRLEAPLPLMFWITTLVRKVELKSKELGRDAKLLYYIPFIDVGVLNKISRNSAAGQSIDYTIFMYNNREWILRHAYPNGDDGGYTIFDYLTTGVSKTDGIFLQTQLGNSTLEELNAEMHQMCYLLSFVYGKDTWWQSLWHDDESNVAFLMLEEGLTSNPSDCFAVTCHDPSGINADRANPVDFIKAAQDEYLKDYDWWRQTLYWYTNASSVRTLEVQKMMESMLLDRVSHKIFSIIVDESLQKNLDNFPTAKDIKNTNKGICKDFMKKVASAKKLAKTQEERDFVKMCKKWIKNPHYANKIEYIFEFAGKKIEKDDFKRLKERHNLMHRGVLSITGNPNEVKLYVIIISEYCLSMMLSLIGYYDYYLAFAKPYKVDKLLPDCRRLKLSNIRALAHKLFI